MRPVETGLAVVLATSLAIKVAVGLSQAEAGTQGSMETRIAAALADNGYATGALMANTEPQLLPVEKAGCGLLIAVVSPLGWHRDLMQRLAGADRTLSYAYAGAVSAEQPVLRTSFAGGRARMMRYLGFSAPEGPVVAVIGEPGCDRAVMEEVARLAAMP